MKTQQIIFKITERCNINCRYCYYFNGNDTSYTIKPALVPEPTVQRLIDYLERVMQADPGTRIGLIFHGGEPLLIGPRRFDALCSRIRHRIPSERLEFSLQTNAMLVNESWIGVLGAHAVAVGVSIDGPERVHDAKRVDKHGHGTYAATRRGTDMLLAAHEAGRLPSVGCLAVIQAAWSGAEIYRHLVHDVGFPSLDFLLPDFSHDDFVGSARDYGRFLIEAFDAWIADDDPEIEIRILRAIVSILLGGKSSLGGFGSDQPNAFTLRSDGQVELEDAMRTCGLDQINTHRDIAELDVEGVVNLPMVKATNASFAKLPDACGGCLFSKSCRGGQITHRFSRQNGLENPSVFCDGLFNVFLHIAERLALNGVPIERLSGLNIAPLRIAH